ncbi:MAG: hypothetical protein IT163_01525 [Bryobacterales bacterium]|nr:hypothetical protein [Bryobacterales bacterium]
MTPEGRSAARKRAARAMDGATILLIVLLIVQIWLLMASVESWLAGHRGVALPAALMSGALFCGCVGLVMLAHRAGRTARTPGTGGAPPPSS